MTEVELDGLGSALDDFLRPYLFCCGYTQTFGHMHTYCRGLLSELKRKSVEPIALAFSDFEGYVRLPTSALHADENLGARRQYVNQVASMEAGARAVISIPLIVATIRDRIGPNRLAKEQ